MPIDACGLLGRHRTVESQGGKGVQTVRINVSYFQQLKTKGIPIVMLTAYDATTARIAEQAGVQVLLVGDTLGMVVQGHDTTVPVTLDEMLYHTRLVVRGTERAFVIGDLPFMTYNISPDQALANAARFLQQAGAQSVKLEGGRYMAPTRSEEHTSELQSRPHLVCRLLLE